MNALHRCVMAGLLAACAAAVAPAATTLTYQGELKQSGLPYNGTADFIFTLYDDAVANSVIGTYNANNVSVVAGQFTVTLSFGDLVFDGFGRWLGTEVRTPAGSGSYVALSPRKALLGVPYAYALALPTYEYATYDFNALGVTNLGTGGAVYGEANGDVAAVQGVTNAYLGFGVQGVNNFVSSTGYLGTKDAGVVGAGGSATGVSGTSTSGFGVVGSSNTSDGVYGASYDGGYGVRAYSASNYGVYAYSLASDGVHGEGFGAGPGVKGIHSGGGIGVEGSSPSGIGVYATNTSTTNFGYLGSPTRGAAGIASNVDGTGVYGFCNNGANSKGVYGQSTVGYAGYFQGKVHITGAITKGSGMFKIDHPLDPANKYLQHSFVESPDMMNIYNGEVTTDAKGYARIALPDYFEALNGEFRYQLTVIDEADSDAFVQAKVVKPIRHNRFTIRTSRSNTRVSWQVTGVRRDAYAKAHPMAVEEPKALADRGKYLHPEAWGKPADAVIGGLAPATRPAGELVGAHQP